MDELQISGKRFISSRRLAREHGYTADYLGQLIRGGKVLGQKVGRAWYVDAVSFDTYLGGEAKVLEPKIPEQRSSVPVVQQSSPDAGEARPFAQEFLAPAVETVQEIKKEELTHYVPLHIIKKEEPAVEEKKEVGAGGLRYYADNEPSLPEIRFNRADVSVGSPTDARRGSESEVFAPAYTRNSPKLSVGILAGAALAVFIFSAVLSSALSLNLSIEAGTTASAWYSLQW